jgi:hypothetical protein
MHSEATKRRIAERISQAHERLRRERGGYLTAEGKASLKAKCAAHYTPERRRWHGERQRHALDLAHHGSTKAADRFARRFLPILLDMQKKGMGLREIAREMNARGYTTRRGCCWTDQAVRQVLKRRGNIIAAEVMKRPRFIGWDRHV